MSRGILGFFQGIPVEIGLVLINGMALSEGVLVAVSGWRGGCASRKHLGVESGGCYTGLRFFDRRSSWWLGFNFKTDVRTGPGLIQGMAVSRAPTHT